MKIKKLGLTFFSLLLMISCILVQSSTAYAAYDKSASQGVVKIVYALKGAYIFYMDDSGNTERAEDLGDIEWASGSGFFVGEKNKNPQYIITNQHVVDSFVKNGDGGAGGQIVDAIPYGDTNLYKCIGFNACELRVYFEDGDYSNAYVVDHGEVEKIDLALLKLREPTDKRKALSISVPDESMQGDEVYAVGFPGNAENYFTSASSNGLKDVTVSNGIIQKMVMNDAGVVRIQTTATIQHGNSGGPLIDEKGSVIGVNTNVWSESPYENQIEADYYSLSSEHVIEMLEKNNVKFEKESGGAGSKVIVIAAIVVAVALLAVFGKKKIGSAKSVVANKVSNKTTASQPVAQEKKGMIKSLNPQHGGVPYAVSAAPIVIGRDANSCRIVYSENTAGVSGRHCTVALDSATGEFIITDIGSTYGTFLMNGQKLAPNVPTRVKSGSSFFVGDRANVLTVELV